MRSPSRADVRGPNRATSVVVSAPARAATVCPAGVGGELADVVGDGRRRVDLDVDDHLGPQRLAHHDASGDPNPSGRRVRRVADVLRTDPDDDLAASG